MVWDNIGPCEGNCPLLICAPDTKACGVEVGGAGTDSTRPMKLAAVGAAPPYVWGALVA